jgi:hypothetical protein
MKMAVPNVTISGTMFTEDGAPIAGARVRYQVWNPATRDWGRLHPPIQSKANGDWSVSVSPDSLVKLVFDAETEPQGVKHSLVPPATLRVMAGGDVKIEQTTYRPALPQIEGSVVREKAINGAIRTAPFAGVAIELRSEGKVVTSTVTDGRGSFEFAPSSSGHLILRSPSELTAPDGEVLILSENEIPVYLTPGTPLRLGEIAYGLKRAIVVGEVTGDGDPLSGVSVKWQHLSIDGERGNAPTDLNGTFRFKPAPGPIQLRYPARHESGGTEWELDATDRVQDINASPLVACEATPINYLPAVHAIRWRTFHPGGAPAPGVLVQVVDLLDSSLIAEGRTDEKGTVYLPVTTGGRYQVLVYEDDRKVRGPRPYVRDVASVLEGSTEIPYPHGKSLSSAHANGDGRALRESIVDLAAYPMFMTSVPSQGGGALSGQPAGAAMSETVSTEIRNVLGWKWRGATPDPAGLNDVLTETIELTEEDGHTVAKLLPRTYLVQSDLGGGITGAQASIYNRAKVAVDAALPLLDGLYPLRIDADPEDSKALKAVVSNQARDLLGELGMVGGPRVTRVDQMFRLLLGRSELQTDPDQVGGGVGTIRKEFGLASDALVNRVEEEQNATNYRIVADYLIGLRQSWLANRDFFLRDGASGRTPFFGTQLVLISRQLAVIGDSVDEVRDIMRSVFISDAERETLEIEFTTQQGGQTAPEPMVIEGLLSWVWIFATGEGPRLIKDGGKWAVGQSLVPMARTLARLVHGARSPANSGDLPAAYFTPRVQRSLAELAAQLDELIKLTKKIKHKIPSQE